MLLAEKKKIVYCMAVLCFAVLAWKVFAVRVTDMFRLFPPRLASSASPARLGSVQFLLEDAFKDNTVFFFVSDPQKGAKPIWTGGEYVTDGDINMVGAAWSRDGSVIAVRGIVRVPDGHQYGEFFVDAYDFRRHQIVARGGATRWKSRWIRRLMNQRGGEGPPLFAGQRVSAVAQVVSSAEARRYYPGRPLMR